MTTFVGNGNYAEVGEIDGQNTVASIGQFAGGIAVVDETSDQAVHLTLYDTHGSPIGSPIQLTAHGHTSDIVPLSSGGFAVAWGEGPSGTNTQIKVQIFDANGAAVAAPTIVSQPTGGVAYMPRLAALPNNQIAVAWTQYTNSTNIVSSFKVSVVDTTGTILTPSHDQFPATDDHAARAIATLASGQLVTLTQSLTFPEMLSVLHVQTYDPAANTFGANDLASITLPAGASYGANSLTALKSGGFLLSWQEQASSSSVHAQVYDSNGGAQGQPIVIANSTAATVEALGGGGFVIGYQSTVGGMTAQIYDAGGHVVGDPFAVNVPTQFVSRGETIAAFGTNDFAVAHTYGISDSTSVVALYHGPIDGTAAGETLNGTADADIIHGLGGNDVLHGLAGDDMLSGGAGADTLDGGADNDTATYDTSPAGVQVSLLTGLGHGGDAEGDTLTSIENLTGSAFDDVLTGDANANHLDGGAGNDTLDGGTGADTMVGGAGNDTYYVDNANDVVIEQPNGGDNDTVYTSVSYTTPDNVESLRLLDGATGTLTANAAGSMLVGNALDNLLQGGAGNDFLDGLGGADMMIGGAGDDTYYVDNVGDVVIEQAGGGTDTVSTTIDYTLPANVENLNSRNFNNTPLTLIGNDLNNTIIENNGGALYGMGGDDVLVPGFGTLYLDGGAGYDIVKLDGGAHSAIPTISIADNGDIIIDSTSHSTHHDIEEIDISNQFFNGTLYTTYMSDIRAQYRTYGGRDPDAGEYVAWSGAMHNGTTVAQVREAILSSSLGKAYVDAQITQAYQTYGGRAPIGNELQVWESTLNGNGHDFSVVGNAIQDSSLGQSYSAQIITQTYQTYAGRAPIGNEVTVWQGVFRTGGTVATLRQAILNDPLGQNHTAAAVSAIYHTYAGRGPTSGEINAANTMLLAGADFTAVRTAVLDSTPIHAYELTQITAAYQNYGGRAPTSDELIAWDGAMHAGSTYNTVRDAILSTSLGHYYVDQQIDAAYQTYGGRAATSSELTAWEGVIGTSQNYGVVKNAILSTSLGHYYVDQQITAAYQTYGGRAPTSAEITAWEGVIGSSQNYGVVKNAILSTSLGQAYTDAQITTAYQTYGGRAPTSAEISAWEGAIGSSQNYGMVKNAILSTSLGQAYTDAQITAAYQTYGGRAPVGNEIQAWEGVLNGNGHDYNVVKNAILSTSLGTAYTDAQITAAYQTYGGRAPIGNELQVWESVLNGNNHDYSVVRNAILSTSLGDDNSSTQIDALYQRYFLRAPTIFEQDAWHSVIKGGADFDALRDVLMSDSGSAATTAQLDGSVGPGSPVNGKPFVVITGFDPANDRIDLTGAGYSGIDPLDANHARQIHQLDGTPDVLITFDASHEILLHNVLLSQLSSSDFLL